MNKIKTKSEQIPRPRPFLYKAKIEKHGTRAQIPKMNSDVPKMNKKSRQDRRNPKKYIKKYKIGKSHKGRFLGRENSKGKKY